MLELDLTIRENGNGKYLFVHAHQFREAIDYAHKTQVPQIQLRGPIGRENLGAVVDFKELEKLSESLRFISFAGAIENIINFDSIYALTNLEKINFQCKQSFNIDVSRFPKLEHLGGEYWKGLTNFSRAQTLTSLVILKLTDENLQKLSGLKKLKILHVYSSKIQTLEGIESLPIEELCLARNNVLEDVQAIQSLISLKRVTLEKCKKIVDGGLLDGLRNSVQTNIIA
jgi:hypothetical protein